MGESGISAKQNDSLPGLPCAARSTPPGRPPPTLRMTSCSARPIVRLARLPWPSALTPLFIPIRCVPGPLHTSTGPTGIVVASSPCMLNSSVHTASRAVMTHGRYSGRHPAITAAIATFSTVRLHQVRRGDDDDDRRPRASVPVNIRSTRSSVGGTTGNPSVQPRSNIASISSSRVAISIRREAACPLRTDFAAVDEVGVDAERPAARTEGWEVLAKRCMPVIRRHSSRAQPTVRSISTPSTTRMSVGTVSMSWCQLTARSASWRASAPAGKPGSSCT